MNEDSPKICFDPVPSEDVVDSSLKIECKNISFCILKQNMKNFSNISVLGWDQVQETLVKRFFFFNYILNEWKQDKDNEGES